MGSKLKGLRRKNVAPSLQAIVQLAAPVLLSAHVRADTCLSSTAIMRDVLGRFGVGAEAMAVDVYASNAEWLAVVKRTGGTPTPSDLSSAQAGGAFFVAVDTDALSAVVGHVVVLADGWLIDMTSRQFARPAKGIPLVEFVMLAYPQHWIEGGKDEDAWVGKEVDGALFTYKARPRDRRFVEMPDYTDPTSKQDADAIVSLLRAGVTPDQLKFAARPDGTTQILVRR